VAVRLVIEGADQIDGRLRRLDEAVRRAVVKAVNKGAVMVHKDAVESVQHGPKTGAIYTHDGIAHQASAPGEAPATDTGELVSSMTFEVDDDGFGASIVAKSPHAAPLEFGTVDMDARPFMGPAFEKNREAIQELVAEAYHEAKSE
jgi:HK97 gp10 family phage protein